MRIPALGRIRFDPGMKNRFLFRILTTYTLIVFALLFLVFMGYYTYMQRGMQEEIDGSHDEVFLGWVGSCEELFSTMHYMAATVMSLNSLDMFAYAANDDYYPLLTQLYNDLSTLNQRLAEQECRVVVHKINDKTAVSGLSTTTVPRILEEIGIDGASYGSILERLSTTPLYKGHYVFTGDKVVYLTSKDYVDDRMIVLVVVQASRFAPGKAVRDMRLSFILHGEGITDLRHGAEGPPPFLDKAPPDDGEAPHAKRIGPITYTWVPSRKLDLQYYYSTDNATLRGQTIRTLANTFLILIGVCLVAFGIIIFFSLRISRPVERLMDSFLSMGIQDDVSEGSKTDLDSLAQQVSRVRRSHQELIQTVEDAKRHSIDNVVYELLTGSYNPETIETELKRLSLERFRGKCHVALFEIGNEPDGPLSKESFHLEKVMRTIGEQLGDEFRLESILFRRDVLCTVIHHEDPQRIKEKLHGVVAVIDTALDLRLTAFIGKTGEGIDGLRLSFASAYRILENRSRLAIKSVYDGEDLRGLLTQVAIYPAAVEVQLIAAVERDRPAELRRLLDQAFTDHIDPMFDNKEERQLPVFALTNTVYRSMQKVGIRPESVAEDGRSLYRSFMAASDRRALKQEALRVFQRIFEELGNVNTLKANRLRDDLARYMEANLGKNISLLDISEHFNLSPNYMSLLFKTTLGENFRDYLARRRFETAVGMLRGDPSIKLVHLAEAVGLNNVNTLIRIFHKFCGQSPGQFVRTGDPRKATRGSA